MDITGIIQQLRQERARIDESILALESLAAGSAPRRGRPPKWIVAARAAESGARRRSQETRAASRQRQETEAVVAEALVEPRVEPPGLSFVAYDDAGQAGSVDERFRMTPRNGIRSSARNETRGVDVAGITGRNPGRGMARGGRSCSSDQVCRTPARHCHAIEQSA